MNKLFLGMIVVSLLAACSSPAPKETISTAPTATPQTSTATDTSASIQTSPPQLTQASRADTAVAQAAVDVATAKTNSDTKEAELALLDKHTVYFDTDVDALQAADKEIIMAHGKNLGKVSLLKARVAGYADERGSSEYNLALGQRRANNTKKALVAAGAKDGQIFTVSYGEEKPVATGHDESAWAQNRRAEIRYDIAK